MGTAQIQGALWGTRAREWADLQEHALLPAYKVAFELLNVNDQTHLLDVGCGTGLATQIATQRGAHITGLDASAASIAIARGRVPQGNFTIGEMEELPYGDSMFDVVTSFNAFQYAANPINALQEARRVLKPGGKVMMVTWGRSQDCEHTATLAAVGSCLPPPPPGSGGPFALSEPGKLEALLEQADFVPTESGEVSCPFNYPDEETAIRSICSAGVVVKAIQYAGEERVYQAVRESLLPYRTATGGYNQHNTFRYVIAVK